MNKRQRLVVIANPNTNRVDFLNEALTRRGMPPATVVSWHSLLGNTVRLDEVVEDGNLVRIESPGRDAAVEVLLTGSDRTAERGEILFPRQWYLGFCQALKRIEEQLAAAPPHQMMNCVADIAAFFDKTATQARFSAAGLPVPRPLPPTETLAQLAEAMLQQGIRQVFVKLAHGSSASGAIALRTDGSGRWRAYTTVEQTPERLYNSRQIRTIDEPSAIDGLLRALAPHGLHIEEWIPKATLDGYGFDVRALVIGGKLRHVVGRLSHTPMTNLHLLNRRADAETVRARVGEAAWSDLNALAEQAASLFPRSLHIGLDILWRPGFKKLYLLEANAFGDLLPGALWNGQTTYDTELEAAGC